MDVDKKKEDYVIWTKIADYRSHGLSNSQISTKLGISADKVYRLSRLTVDEVLRRNNQRYTRVLDLHEKPILTLLIEYPALSIPQIHERLRDSIPLFPRVCEKTLYNYIKYIRNKYNIPQRE